LGILGEKSRILDFLGRILELFWRSSGKNFRPFFGNNVLKPRWWNSNSVTKTGRRREIPSRRIPGPWRKHPNSWSFQEF